MRKLLILLLAGLPLVADGNRKPFEQEPGPGTSFKALFNSTDFGQSGPNLGSVSDDEKSFPPDNSPLLVTSASEPDFTIVLFPDAQNMVQLRPSIWRAMAQWVVDNRAAWNVRAVIGLGDLTNNHTEGEFSTALAGWETIARAEIPSAPIMGNHDYDSLVPRLAASCNRNFGPDRFFAGRSWYGSEFPSGSNENFYITFEVGRLKVLVLALEFYPRACALQWAQQIVNTHPDHDVIIATHAYLDNFGNRTKAGDQYGSRQYGLPMDSDGDQLWQSFLKPNDNVVAVVGGHFICSPHMAWRTDLVRPGRAVNQIFANYQCAPDSGGAYLVRLLVRPSSGVIEVSSYSPLYGAVDPELPPLTLPYLHRRLERVPSGRATGRSR